jgi:histone H3/H4
MVEYRIASPNTAEVPTVTQMGLIGAILMRTRQKQMRRACRRARFQRILRATTEAFAWRRVAHGAVVAPSAEAVPAATAKHA